jgi:hypothetical protein
VDVVTSVIELGVGLGCLAGGVVACRLPRYRLIGVLLVVAGLAASAHAVLALLDN